MIRVASWASRASLAAAILLAAAPILERFAPDTWPGGPWFSLGLLGLLLLRLGCGRAARGDWRLPPLETALVSAWAVYALAVSNGGARTSSDNLPARELGASVLDGRGLDLGELAARRPGDEYSLVEVRGRWLPAFPLGTGFLALPHEAMARAAAVAPPDEATRLLREKHAAALLSALAVGLMAAGLRTRWPTLPALGSALAFGLASPHLAVDAQGLWAQTGETASLGLAVALLSRRRLGTVGGAAAGIASGAAFFCRPTALLLLPVLAALPQRPARRALRAGLIAATVVVASVLLLQLGLYAHPLGGYGLLNEREGGAFGTANLAEGMAGVLVSPSRGLLVFCPWVLMVALATCASRRPRARRVALGAWISAAAVLLAAAGHAKWWGGHSLGPRLAIEAAFALALALPPVWGRGRRSAARRVALAALVILSAGLQLALARSAAAGDWNEAAIVDHLAGRVLWRWKDSQLAAALIPGWTLELPPYDETRLDPRQAGSRRVFFDLGEAADARYETDPFRTSPLRGLAPAFRRLDPDRLRTGKQLFRFLPRGAPNAVTVGEGEVAAFDVHPLRDADLFVLLSALDLAGVPEGTEVARLVLRTSDGKRRDYPLRLEEDVFRFGPASGRQLPPRAFLYAGLLNQPDVLIGTQLRARRLAGALERVELRGTSKGVRVSLLAATLAAPERRGKGRRAARPEVIDRVREK